jgi:hypothetical protein
LADATDLKSVEGKTSCGFESHLGYCLTQLIKKKGIVMSTIDVTDLDPAALMAGLHNNTVTPNTWACGLHALHRNITAEEAREELGNSQVDGVPFFPDYVFGRPIKAFLKKGDDDRVYLVRTDLYDRDAGEGKALKVVQQVRKKGDT